LSLPFLIALCARAERRARDGSLLYLDSYNEGRSMNAATRDKIIGGVVWFATFAFFSTIIAGFFN
jgi:hypothetical protein